MSGGDETRDDQWGNAVARKTFIMTLISAVLFAAAVALFILNADTRR
jgi:hypothetical protein